MDVRDAESGRPVKRFKHQSYNETLKDVHLPSALNQAKFDNEIPDGSSHFHEALDHWRQLNLSPAFLVFANKADGLSASMPLLLHHWKDILNLWATAVEESDYEGLIALADLLQKLAHDLRTTILPVYLDLLSRLYSYLPRKIPAPTLTALLSALSALFKYLLIPSADAGLLDQSWSSLRDVLPKCNPEVQRAVAEVWGATLRRLKSAVRERAVELIAEDVDGLEDACAWMVVFACESVSQTLHTATASIVTPLLKHHLACAEPEKTYTLLRRLLTALIHHCKGPEQFSAVADALLDQVAALVQGLVDEKDHEPLRRMLEVLAVVCSVRQGSRLSQKQISIILSHVAAIPLTESLQASLLKLTVAALIAGELSLSLGPGRKVVEQSLQHPPFALQLYGSLAELQWGGWKLIALPNLLKAAPDLLHKEPRRTAELLATLYKKGMLGEVDAGFKVKFGEWARAKLSSWQKSEEQVFELASILALSGMIENMTELLVRLIEDTLAVQDPVADYEASYTNSSWVLASCMEALSRCRHSEWHQRVDLTLWTENVVQRWGWSEGVLGGMVSLIDAGPTPARQLAFESTYSTMKDALLSHVRALRLSALRLLTSRIVQTPESMADTMKRCLQAEEVPLDVRGVRERTVKVTRMPLTIKDESSAEVASRWLLAQFKVNLRPLWAPTSEAVVALSQRFGDLVWNLVFDQLQKVSLGEIDAHPPSWVQEEMDGEGEDDIWEDEKSWRDPSAHKVRTTLNRWQKANITAAEIFGKQKSGDRLDTMMYETRVLHALGECASLAEKHNRDIISFFLSLTAPDSPAKLPRPRLNAWLTLFSKFVNPKALYASEKLHALYISLLSHPDRSLQRLALSCLLTYKSASLLTHEDTLRGLLDDTRWRDQLTMLDMSEIEEKDRPELVSVIIRILFGIMLEKRGRSRGADRRGTILTTLAGCTDEELSILVDLMVDPLQLNATIGSDGDFTLSPVSTEVSTTQQLGFLTLLGDVLRNLGSRLIARWPVLLGATISLTAHAQRSLDTSKDNLQQAEEASQVSEPDDVDSNSPLKSLRSTRQLGLKRLADFARVPVQFDFSPYLTKSFPTIISPRMDHFETENTQAPSALLELFYAWACRTEYISILVSYDERILPKIYDCLVAASVKPAVVSRIFDIIEHTLQFCPGQASLQAAFVRHVSLLLTNLTLLVERAKDIVAVTSALGQRQIAILCQIVYYVNDSSQAETLLKLFLPILRKPSKVVPEKIKIDVLKIVEQILPLAIGTKELGSTIYVQSYDVLSALFQTLRLRASRLGLVAAFRKLAAIDLSLRPLVDLMDSLNAFSQKRMDEPDFDRRLSAFTTLNEQSYSSLTARQWVPILYNMLYFIQDPEELAVRHSASLGIRRFIDIATEREECEYQHIFLRNLYPALRNGLRTKYEMVRAEVLAVVAYAVTRCDFAEPLRELRVLCADGDEEANFFNNIFHVQIHRRTRALRRLADACDHGLLKSRTVNEVLIPLVGHFVTSPASLDHHLVNEAVLTTGHMAKCLAWSAYYALVQQYIRLCQKRDDAERVYVRALVAILDNFHFQMGDSVSEEEKTDDADDGEVGAQTQTPSASRVEQLVTGRLLPSLLSHLEKRDETEDSLRVPIAVGIVQVANHLPVKAREVQVARLLTIVSQALRSRSQETRDLVRETLCRIAVVLGPEYLPLILRELRAALQRGPHLHVLAFVTHALLVHVTNGEHSGRFETLDGCVDDAAHVSAEVIFGQSGRDVQAEEFKTKMREVRSSASKGLDSFAIMAKFITPAKISRLLNPVKTVMHETESLKVMQQVDDLLRRIASGLNANRHLVPTELLVLCHTFISQNARFLQANPKEARSRGRGKGKEKEKAAGQLKRAAPAESDHYAHNSFRFVAFGLELFSTAFRRSRFDFQDKTIIARLEPMVSVIGNTLYSTNAHVTSLGLKASAAIVKCPLQSIDKTLPVFVRRSIEIIRETGTTASDLVQTALKSLATILRDCPKAEVKEKDLTFLLELLQPDLEEPSRQPAVFAMLRAIVARKFVVPEIYDAMDKVSEIMVTSQSAQVQELCRGVLLQFLLDYPQGKGRLRNSMTFFARNLSYVHESGRKSVMELLSAVIAKFDVNLVREYADLLFVALVMVIANDDSAKCREMAAELIKSLFVRLNIEHRRLLASHLHSWASQTDRPVLARVSSQVYGLMLDALHQEADPFLPTILEDLGAALRCSADSEEMDEVEQGDNIKLEWQAPYQALIVSGKVLREFPALTRQDEKVQWPTVVSHLLYPHSWVRLASCRLLGTLFAAVPVDSPSPELPADHPLSTVGMEEAAKRLCTQLKSQHLDEALSLQVVKNLFYIGKCFAAIPSQDRPTSHEEAGSEAEAEDDSDGEDSADTAPQKGKHPLPWLFSRLSYQARSAHIARRNKSRTSENWFHQPVSVFKWFAAMSSFLPKERLEQFLVHILTPVYRIVEDETIRDPHMDELKTLAIELQDLVRDKVGTTAFANTYNKIRQGVLEVRRERKTARAMLVATNPEAAAKRKQGRNMNKKESRKRKNASFADSKGRLSSKKRREHY